MNGRASGSSGRSYALALASVRMLRALGLWDALEDHVQPILQIKASDGRRAKEGRRPSSCISTAPKLEEGPIELHAGRPLPAPVR